MKAIFEIDVNRRTPKYQQIANSITKAIKLGKIKRGDRILSINELSNEFMLSRDTVQRAYYLLEKEKVLQAVRGKGFYINRTDVFQRYKILIVFDRPDISRQQIFQGIVETFGDRARVDAKIYQCSLAFVEEMVDTVTSDYDYCIIMPGFCPDNPSTAKALRRMPPDKLILLDRHLSEQFKSSLSVYDDPEKNICTIIERCSDQLKRYRSVLYVNPGRGGASSAELKTQFNFWDRLGLQSGCTFSLTAPEVSKGRLFIVSEDKDLVGLVKMAEEKKLKPGKDFGIISSTEGPLQEVLAGGITTISTDYCQMGLQVAQNIIDGKKHHVTIPLRCIQRRSF